MKRKSLQLTIYQRFRAMIMLHIPKDRVQNLLVLERLAQIHQLNEAIVIFERRYDAPFAAFEERVNSATEEDMTAWDDYI